MPNPDPVSNFTETRLLKKGKLVWTENAERTIVTKRLVVAAQKALSSLPNGKVADALREALNRWERIEHGEKAYTISEIAAWHSKIKEINNRNRCSEGEV